MTPSKTGKVLNWASDLDPKAANQAHISSEMPFVFGHLALMPDAHYGLGATIGSVIPTLGAIMPAAVGVDIGCGMIAVETTLTAANLPDDLGPLLSSVEQVIPAGVGQGNQRTYQMLRGDAWYKLNPNTNVSILDLGKKTAEQFGSLGSGNHFVELCLDERDVVWCVLHSGSRGVGNQLARIHIDRAKGLMKERFINLEDPNLAYLVEGDASFTEYIRDLRWAQDYALGNREEMMDRFLRELSAFVGRQSVEKRRVNCHHNYTEKEHHMGKDLWVTRKGAIRARVGDLGVIPGSMGTASYIVEGLGNPASFNSASHGAGRQMSRTRAKAELSMSEFCEQMSGKAWQVDKAHKLMDEAPGAYKDIDQVMADQADLVVIKHTLHQVMNYKGA